jgi:hypothetical protein
VQWPPTPDRDDMTTTSIVVVLELDLSADCPSGSAAVSGREPREFHGWLGLAAAINALATPSPERASEDVDESPSRRKGETR